MSLTLADIDATLARLRLQKQAVSERISFYVEMRKQALRKEPDPFQRLRGPANEEHAYRLRSEGLKFADIAARLGVTTSRARELMMAHKRHELHESDGRH